MSGFRKVMSYGMPELKKKLLQRKVAHDLTLIHRLEAEGDASRSLSLDLLAPNGDGSQSLMWALHQAYNPDVEFFDVLVKRPRLKLLVCDFTLPHTFGTTLKLLHKKGGALLRKLR